jgi:hypothetical protein
MAPRPAVVVTQAWATAVTVCSEAARDSGGGPDDAAFLFGFTDPSQNGKFSSYPHKRSMTMTSNALPHIVAVNALPHELFSVEEKQNKGKENCQRKI